MSKELSAAGDAVRANIEARLDAVDRLLLGFIPRHERMAIMRSLEDRLRSIAANAPVAMLKRSSAAGQTAFLADEAVRDPLAALAEAVSGDEPIATWRPNVAPRVPKRRRSKLAIGSAILGVVAGGLLLCMPLAYFAIGTFAEILDETSAILLGGAYLTMTLLCSAAAIAAGLAALWRIRKRQPAIVGTGWAITGLCTAPIPFAAASLLALVIGVQMLGSVQFSGIASTSDSGSAEVADGPIDGRPLPEPIGGPYASKEDTKQSPAVLPGETTTGLPVEGKSQAGVAHGPSPLGKAEPITTTEAVSRPSPPALPSAAPAEERPGSTPPSERTPDREESNGERDELGT